MARSTRPPTMTLTDAPRVPPKDPDAARLRRRRLRKRLALGGLGLLLILLVVFLLLPQWISNEQGRAYVLQRLNKRSNTKIAVGNWSLGWFHGTELTDVKVTLADSSFLLTCPSVHSDLTLWSILWGRYDLGTTTADNLQIHLIKYANGTTSLDALLPTDPAGEARLHRALQTFRGSLLTKSASLTITSQATGAAITYDDVKAGVTIASPDAPFHVQLSALAADGHLSLNATLPALASWPVQRPTAILANADFDLAATQLPTALLCDFLNLDAHWQDSFGPTLVTCTLSNHAAPPSSAQPGTVLSLLARGPTADTFIDGRLLLIPPIDSSPSTLSLPPMGDYSLRMGLNVSRPLAAALAHINPVFAQLSTGTGPVIVTLSSLRLSPSAPGDTELTGRITFPAMTFRREGLVAALLQHHSPDSANGILSASASPLRVRLENGRFDTEPFLLTFDRHERITFSGTVAIGGGVDLLATVPTYQNGLGSGTADIPIQGTVDAPFVAPEQ